MATVDIPKAATEDNIGKVVIVTTYDLDNQGEINPATFVRHVSYLEGFKVYRGFFAFKLTAFDWILVNLNQKVVQMTVREKELT